MDREKIDGWCEKGILSLVLTILVFGPLALGGADVWEFLTLQGLTLGVMFLWGVRLWVKPRAKFLWPPVCWAVLAFVIYALVRYCQADIEYVARRELIQILVYAFLFFAILNNLHGQDATRVIVLTLVFLGMTITFYAFYQFVTGSNRVWNLVGSYPGRGTGTYYNPDHFAGFLEMLLPLGVCYMLVGRLSHVTKIFLGYASVMMLAGIGISLSRGGWLVTGVVLLLLCGVLLLQRNYRLQALIILVLLIGTGVLATKMDVAKWRYEKSFNAGKASDVRFEIWRPTVRMWRDNFWLGVGPGHYDHRFAAYRPETVQKHPGWAHNDYLNTLADYGTAGAALVAAAWLLLFGGVVKTWKYIRPSQNDFARKQSNKFALLLGAALGLAGLLLHSAFDFNLHIPANAILAVTLMALLSSQWRFATEQFWFKARLWSKITATLALLAGLGWLGWTEVRGAQEYACLRQARHAPQYTYERINALKKAWEAEPANEATTYAIADIYLIKSRVGSAEYTDLAQKAMEWYRRSMKLDPFDARAWAGYGMCLDWIGPQPGSASEESAPYLQHALELDPNGFVTAENLSWHYEQTGDAAAARTCLERACNLEWHLNNLPLSHLEILDKELKDAANWTRGLRKRP